MVAGLGPRIAPNSASIPAYADAPIARQVHIESYIGVPLNFADGSLFGTLCAIDPAPHPDRMCEELALIELLASMLSGLLHDELVVAEATRRAERAQADAETDALTELYNRRAWDRLLTAEETRCRKFASPASVVVVDLDGLKHVNDSQGHLAGDNLIRRAGMAIKAATRDSDVAARVGGDEFAVLGAGCDDSSARQLIHRIRTGLRAVGVSASAGYAVRIPGRGLLHAWKEADRAMYREKSAHADARKSVDMATATAQLASRDIRMGLSNLALFVGGDMRENIAPPPPETCEATLCRADNRI